MIVPIIVCVGILIWEVFAFIKLMKEFNNNEEDI